MKIIPNKISTAHPKSKAAWGGTGVGAALSIVLAWVANDVVGYTVPNDVVIALTVLILEGSRSIAKLLYNWRVRKC